MSVVIATRNRWPLLSRHALPSVLAQEGVSLEVIVVDDASTDETPARLAELADPRVRVVRNPAPRRLPGARNAGIDVAEGAWLGFLDDDDVWSPDKLRLQLAAAEDAERDWVYGRSVVVDACLEVLGGDLFPQPDEVAELLRHGNWIPGGGSNVIARSDLVRRVGAFDEELFFFEDWDLWLRLADEGPPAACDDVVMARVEHGGNMVIRDRAEVMRAYERFMGRRRRLGREDRLAVAEWLAHEHHRAGRRLAAARLYLHAAVAYRSAGNLPAAVGAAFGDGGLRGADLLLRRLRGGSHLLAELPQAEEPLWLRRFRAGAST